MTNMMYVFDQCQVCNSGIMYVFNEYLKMFVFVQKIYIEISYIFLVTVLFGQYQVYDSRIMYVFNEYLISMYWPLPTSSHVERSNFHVQLSAENQIFTKVSTGSFSKEN